MSLGKLLQDAVPPNQVPVDWMQAVDIHTLLATAFDKFIENPFGLLAFVFAMLWISTVRKNEKKIQSGELYTKQAFDIVANQLAASQTSIKEATELTISLQREMVDQTIRLDDERSQFLGQLRPLEAGSRSSSKVEGGESPDADMEKS